MPKGMGLYEFLYYINSGEKNEFKNRGGNNKMRNRGQVWVETVIYTLIALVMIGAVLTFAKPKIEQMQDKATIAQTIELLENLNTIILDVRKVSGNQRVFDIGIKKGEMIIDAENEKISFEIESKHEYSQIGEKIKRGSVDILTEEISEKKLYKVILTLDYLNSRYDFQLKSGENVRKITKAASLYKIFIVNKGQAIDGRTTLEFDAD
jgi:hypothetical protein